MADIISSIDWSALVAAIPSEIMMWVKIGIIAIAVYFIVLIIKNLIQIGSAWRIRKISKNVAQINNKMDLLLIPQQPIENQY